LAFYVCKSQKRSPKAQSRKEAFRLSTRKREKAESTLFGFCAGFLAFCVGFLAFSRFRDWLFMASGAMAAHAGAAAEAMACMASGATAAAQPAQKRARGTPLQAAEKCVAELSAALEAAQAKQEQAQANEEQQQTKGAVVAAEKADKRVLIARAKLSAAKDKLKKKLAAAAAEKELAEAKARKAAAKEEVLRPMSEAGLLCLIETRIELLRRFNIADLSDSSWMRVRADFMAKVELGELPASDGRSAAALATIFQRELGEFKLRNAIAKRAASLASSAGDAFLAFIFGFLHT
jgi:hypothetical protein